MKKEDKELLLKDLCARLPYGVIVDYKENEFEFPHWKITTIYPETLDVWIGYYKRVGAGSKSGSKLFNIGEFKPYLRSMSSMTEKEEEEYEEVIRGSFEKQLEFYLRNHLDFRGLIPKGLALPAPKDMYNEIKEEKK